MKRFVQARVNGGSNYDSLKVDKEIRQELNSLFPRRVVSSCNVQHSERVWCALVRKLLPERGLIFRKLPLPANGTPVGKHSGVDVRLLP